MANKLADALRNAGAKVAAPPLVQPEPALVASKSDKATGQPSRRETVALTVHFPEKVRRQLKILSSEEGRHMDDMVAEALNLLFAAYRKPEIAPRKADK